MKVTTRELVAAGPVLSAGIISANLLQLGEDLDALGAPGIDVVHIDVMDGVFCPQLTVGPAFVKAIPDRFVKDCHLMIDEPLTKVLSFVDAGADIITFHLEASKHPHRVLQELAGSGVVRGLALNPGTPVATIAPLLDDIELLLILAVNPGWGGQQFIDASASRLVEARRLIEGRDVVVGIDGGVTKQNISHVAGLGADVIVSGSAIFDGTSPGQNAEQMLAAIRSAAGGVGDQKAAATTLATK